MRECVLSMPNTTVYACNGLSHSSMCILPSEDSIFVRVYVTLCLLKMCELLVTVGSEVQLSNLHGIIYLFLSSFEIVPGFRN